jgi:outer membrane protein assembly factor BamB
MRPIVALVTVFASSFAWAGDFEAEKFDNWHQWRGPLATGEAPKGNPPTNWDATTNIKWKAKLDGRGSATPIIWNNRVFVVTAIPTDKKIDDHNRPNVDPRFEKKTQAPDNYYQFIVICLDRNSGKELWRKTAAERVPHEGHHETHSYAAGSPTTDGKLLYVSFGSFGIYAYDLDGNLKWQRDLGRLNTRLGWGEAVTPVIYGDSLLLNWDQEADSALICLDAKSGATKWRAPRDERTSWNTPLVASVHGEIQVIVNGTNRIRSYDLTTGKPIWECDGMTVNAIPSAVSKDGIAYLMSGYQGKAAVAVSLESVGDLSGTNKVIWRYAKGTPYVPSPLLIGDRLWFTQANTQLLTVLDIKSGKPVIDQERLPKVTSFYGSPAAADGRVYFTARDGTTVILKQSDKLELLAVNKLDDTIDASPAIAGRQLFLRGEKFIYCIEEK